MGEAPWALLKILFGKLFFALSYSEVGERKDQVEPLTQAHLSGRYCFGAPAKIYYTIE